MSNLTIKDINSAITGQDWTDEQLRSIWDAVKFARSRMGRKAIWSLQLGSTVKFTHTRTGRVHIGTVTKIKQKNVIVREGMTNWNVPASMLSAA